MSGQADILKAKADAALAKERLLASAHDLQARLKVGALASDAWERVKDQGESAAERTAKAAARHPVATSAAGVGLAALVLRKPLARLFRRNPEPAQASSGTSEPTETDDEQGGQQGGHSAEAGRQRRHRAR